MASPDGLMGYGYEILLHNRGQVRACKHVLQTAGERKSASFTDSPPLPGKLQGQAQVWQDYD